MSNKYLTKIAAVHSDEPVHPNHLRAAGRGLATGAVTALVSPFIGAAAGMGVATLGHAATLGLAPRASGIAGSVVSSAVRAGLPIYGAYSGYKTSMKNQAHEERHEAMKKFIDMVKAGSFDRFQAHRAGDAVGRMRGSMKGDVLSTTATTHFEGGASPTPSILPHKGTPSISKAKILPKTRMGKIGFGAGAASLALAGVAATKAFRDKK